MTFRLRAVRALVLLAGFYLMGVVLLAAMAAVDWIVVTRLFSRVAEFQGAVVAVTVLLAVAILRGMFSFLRAGRLGPAPHAVAVTPQEQPELWEEVRAAAEATGEPAPDELYLTAEVNAGVAEQSRLLGLLPGRRRMLLGLPLLAGLSVPRLRAVLAHEFGHYSNLDTRLGGLTMRGRQAVLHTVKVFSQGTTRMHHVIGALYVGYARMFLRTSQSMARHQELAADQVAARHAGRDATAGALGALPVLDAAYAHYWETYAEMGIALGALPPVGEVHGGFGRLLAARPGERLAALSAGQRPPRPHRYDSHPPTAERIALIEQLPADGRADGPGDEPAALTLLRDPDQVFAALEQRTLSDQAARLRRVDWDELVMARAIADAEAWSQPLRLAVARALRADGAAPARRGTAAQGAEKTEEAELPGLEEVLDAFDRGLLWMAVADRMPKPPQASRLTGSSARNFIRPRLFDGLAGMVHLRLAGTGHAAPDIAWSGRPGLALPADWEKAMDDALDAALSDTPDTAPLRALLAGTV
ncbi:Zn-dependent protease with chaperone function [Streptomyces sp. DvalAA-14]|uniref:M48 family metallopeptidase n=1 Tax=unclassified Streptomyces TaxID=2593676 RepID=UPI00081BC0FD|nr:MULTISPECIES: M48 family metallopeptidase [unclassified Streptomyces]MYS22680.1 M48 family metalloprotease [Streptomyces sp. SID4948]SCE20480.1 Zn-dependent protease with chaperone function [Streptomyces sp. DvalAA-14]